MGSCPDNISRTTMKFFLAVILPFIWGALASVNANLATETFSQIIKIGKTKGKCTFSLSYTNTAVTLSSSKVVCTKKSPKTKSTRQTISAPSGFLFEITLRINKPNSKILGAEILQVPDTTTTSTTTRKTTTITTTTNGAEETTTPTRSGKEVTEESLPGAWVVIQKRGQDGNQVDYFTKTMAEYMTGFADNRESWLGLEEIARMTQSGTWELEVSLEDWSGREMRATYGEFKVGEAPRYELTVTKYDFGSSLRDALRYHNGAAFSTIDEDQDQLGGNCAQKYGGGGWWYRACYHARLNGRIEEGGAGGARAATWFSLKVKASTMKIRKIEN